MVEVMEWVNDEKHALRTSQVPVQSLLFLYERYKSNRNAYICILGQSRTKFVRLYKNNNVI